MTAQALCGSNGHAIATVLFLVDSPPRMGLWKIMALTPGPLCSDNSCLLCKLKKELRVLTQGHLSRSPSLRVLSKSLRRACSAVLVKTRSVYSKRALCTGGCRE